MRKIFCLLLVIAILPFVYGCAEGQGSGIERSYPIDQDDARRAKHGRITGEGLKLFGSGGDEGSGSSGIGVNSFLWRASLDTLSFMPLSSVDPHGGVIITDWYENPDSRGERFKINVVILGTQLRSDGVRVSVFKQKKKSGNWIDSKVSKNTARDLEDSILTRARELRITSAKRKE